MSALPDSKKKSNFFAIPKEYKNLTKLAKTEKGKSVSDWINKDPGKTAIAQFKASHPEIAEPIITKEGRGGGTYAHPSLAAIFAAWCDPQFTAELSDEVIRQRECMKALQARNMGNVYELEAVKDFDNRLEYLVEAGYSYEEIAAMKPIPVKKGYCGWIVEGEFAVEVANRFGLEINVYDGRKRAAIGKPVYRQGRVVGVNCHLGKTISEVGVKLASGGYAAFIWGQNFGE